MNATNARSPRLVRAGRTGPARHCRLTPDEVRRIRRDFVPGCRVNGLRAQARRYGVSVRTVDLIVRRELWKGLD
jgi:hypothetical protein